MPGFDGTGPLNAGSMTGHGGGYCMSYVGAETRFNRRFSRGGGRGWRHWRQATGLPRWARWAPGITPLATVFAPPLNGGQELSFLKGQVEYLEKALEQTKNRISELENLENKD